MQLTPEQEKQYRKDSAAALMSGRGGILLTVGEWLKNNPTKIKMKTKLEIIAIVEETFKNSSDRSVMDEGWSCVYDNGEGRKCAVGLFMESPEKYTGSFHALLNYDRKDRVLNPDSTLKPEYQGHSLNFWIALQAWHDNGGNFTADGLSEEGANELSEIKGKYLW